MRVFSALLSPFALSIVCLPLPLQGKKWDPLFDYTHLQPSNEEYWASLEHIQIPLEKALEVVKQTEGEFRLQSARLRTRPEGSAWELELFVGAAADQPKRVDLTLSTNEPKVLSRVELLTLAPGEDAIWNLLKKAKVAPEEAIEIAKKRIAGKGDEPAIADPRIRTARFQTLEKAPSWEFEIVGDEAAKEQIRRYQIQIDAQAPLAKTRTLLDRFAGEPLRKNKPVELPNGMLIHDFVQGDGQTVAADSKIKVDYRLFLLDGTKLHDTWYDKRPETFEVSKAPLRGMTEGLVGMRVGGRRKIAMPYTLAFGEAGNEIAPPKAMVICDIFINDLVTE